MRQVIGSIQILCMDVLGGEGFSGVPWDDLFLGAQALSPDHATLAREAVLTEDGKPIYVKPKSGQLEKVAAQYRSELDSFLVELRSRQYSIRTEQSYENWILRFLACHQGWGVRTGEFPCRNAASNHCRNSLRWRDASIRMIWRWVLVRYFFPMRWRESTLPHPRSGAGSISFPHRAFLLIHAQAKHVAIICMKQACNG